MGPGRGRRRAWTQGDHEGAEGGAEEGQRLHQRPTGELNDDGEEASTKAAATVTAGDARVTAPDAPAPEAGRVRARVATNPGMPEARLTSGLSVTTRPDVRAFQAREAEELAVRRARPISPGNRPGEPSPQLL